jgi:hypothetical protein
MRLADLGFSAPTAVQFRALNYTLPGANKNTGAFGQEAIVHAQTGSGKTLRIYNKGLASDKRAKQGIRRPVPGSDPVGLLF